MTVTGAGGVIVKQLSTTSRFDKQFKKLPPEIQRLVPQKLEDLLANPRPAGLRFEKLKGYARPDIYTIHITGNYKISFEIDDSVAILRCIGNHNEIDRLP
jgi:mRNA-degrading endonuclease RelE of RelBE toxin-antitoxin system